MLSNWPIRVKLLIGLGLLLLLVITLASSGVYTTLAYRSLVRGLQERAVELPLGAELSRQVADLRITLGRLRGLRENPFPDADADRMRITLWLVRAEFPGQLDEVEKTLLDYRRRLEHKVHAGSRIADNQRELETLHKIEAALSRVDEASRDEDWMLDDDSRVERLDTELANLQQLTTTELPSHLYNRLRGFRDEVRSQYRTLIVGTCIAGVAAGLILVVFVRLFYRWVFRPLRVLIDGSRRVAAGQFGYRIRLDTRDEMAELAEAMNAMTARFQAIRDDLDRQVRERTKQVVRSEQLASVGFLAAGVAHEINNPLATIAMSAESLESRIHEILDDDNQQHAVIAGYLRMIQSEAFRCKEITEKLLDFSRTHPTKRENTELGELVQGVIEMVGRLGRYQEKQIDFQAAGPIIAPVNPQEMKQIVLNLLTNALESVEEGGSVRIRLARREGFAELSFADNGCGMAPEVLEHVFEPFFTRRPAGQGTGLGLSITHRIVADHGGEIDADSPGPGQGATFRVRLPLTDQQREIGNQYPATSTTPTAVC